MVDRVCHQRIVRDSFAPQVPVSFRSIRQANILLGSELLSYELDIWARIVVKLRSVLLVKPINPDGHSGESV